MRNILILCLALFIVFSFGCSKKQEEAPKTEAVQEAAPEVTGSQSPMFDVVSKEEIDVTTAQYSFEYNGVIYYFTTAENMEAFKADPVKYLTPTEVTPPQAQ